MFFCYVLLLELFYKFNGIGTNQAVEKPAETLYYEAITPRHTQPVCTPHARTNKSPPITYKLPGFNGPENQPIKLLIGEDQVINQR